MSLTGTTLGRYRVGARLGRGGMGTVYRAETMADGAPGAVRGTVAIKVFHAEHVEDAEAFARFEREAEIGKAIHHPHLVRTYGLERAESPAGMLHFLVMELIEGRTLAALAEELGSVPESMLLELADQALAALEALHARGVVHCDVKPENLVITPDHRVLLMDLGVARRGAGASGPGAGFQGSLVYAAPEQFAEQADVGPRADLYALGATLYELATGRDPYAGLPPAAVIARKLEEELPPPRACAPDLGAFWDRVIHTCTRSRPTQRFGSATELRRILAEGETGTWWRRAASTGAGLSAERALARLRVERRVPLVGRDAPRRRLAQAQERARASGEALLVAAPLGGGASRLVHEHVRTVAGADGPLIAAGRARGAAGYGPFIEALGDLLAARGAAADAAAPDLAAQVGALLPGQAARVEPLAAFLDGRLQPGAESGVSKEALHDGVLELLRALAAERPLLLVIEDLHAAAPEALALFRHLARGAGSLPLLLLGVHERGAQAEDGAFGAWLEATREEPALGRLDLEPLDREAAAAVVRAVVGEERSVRTLEPVLHARAQGNPRLLLELLDHLREAGVLVASEAGLAVRGRPEEVALPSSLRDLADLRLAELDDEQREMLETASVLGAEWDLPLLAAVLEEPAMELLQRLALLVRRHRLLVDAGQEHFAFASAYLHEAVYEGIPEGLREEYHGLVADTLLEGLEGEPDGERAHALLRHLFLAGRALEAEPWLEPALEHMAGTCTAGEAAAFLERVARAFEQASPRARLALAMKLWSFHEMGGRREAETRALERAAQAAEALGEPGPRARVHALRAGTQWYAGDYEAAHAEAQAGLACAREAGSKHWEATCLHTLGVVAFRRGETAACAETWREALALRREIEDRRGIASTLQALALVMRALGEEERILPTMEESLALWREIGERRGEAALLMNLGNHHIDAARYEQGLGYLEQALRMHRETGAVVNEAVVLTNRGQALNSLGRADEALESWRRALGIFVDHGNPNGELAVRVMLGSALAEYGEWRPAQEQLDAARALAERTGNRSKLSMARRSLAALLLDAGEGEAAREHMQAALALDREQGDAAAQVLSLALCGRAALEAGQAGQAVTLLEEAAGLAGEMPVVGPWVQARLAWARHAVGDTREAEGLAHEALAQAGEDGALASRDGPEILFACHRVLGEPELLVRARASLAERAARVGNDTFREHLLRGGWPGAAIQRAAQQATPDGEDAP